MLPSDAMNTCTCPLCGATDTQEFYQDVRDGVYVSCAICRLVVLAPHRHPDLQREYERYCLHRNTIEDAGYCRHLNRLLDILVSLLPAGAVGLDYGCGPQPILAQLLARHGFRVAGYDPFFQPDTAPLNGVYDFITCTEVIEHFRRPGEEFARLAGMLKPGGMLGLLTEWLEDGQNFRTWHYRRDFTHLCFYRRETMEWIAARHSWRTVHLAGGVAIFSR